jgi:hypothetical protein
VDERDMPRNVREAYERAFGFAVLERDVRFTLADEFAHWFVRIGRHTYIDDLDAAWEHWLAGPDRPRDAGW